MLSDCSRIAWRTSSSPKTRNLWRRCGTSWGLYLNPPDRAIVLCVDEKSQVQALNRTEADSAAGAGRPRSAVA